MESETIEGLQAVREKLVARRNALDRAIGYIEQKITALGDMEALRLIQEVAISLPPPGPVVLAVEAEVGKAKPPRGRPRNGKQTYGIAPVASRILRAVFSPDTDRPLPASLEGALEEVYGGKWGNCKIVQQPAGRGRIVTITLGEDLSKGTKSILRRDIQRGVERLWRFHCGTVPNGHQPSKILISLHRVIDVDKRWETIVGTLGQWGIQLEFE